jgi:aspartate racemase
MELRESPMLERVIGILGGMGPRATVDFYREILTLTPGVKDQDHMRVLIYSNPKIPDRTAAILDDGEDPLPHLVESARVLERGGAGILAIPCNTAHYFLPRLQPEIGIKILDMIAETLLDLKSQAPQVRTVGLLAATGTVRSGIYHRRFHERGIKVIVPDAVDQPEVQGGIQQVKATAHNRQTAEKFHAIGGRLVAAGAEAIILGCTEIPLAFDQKSVSYLCLNATRSLARAAVDWALGKRD